MTEYSEINEKFIRWQSITIAQLSYAINLILTFSVAALGFSVTLLLNENFNPESWQSFIFSMSLFLLLLSGAFGVWCTINRLRDFRASAQINNVRKKEVKETEEEKLNKLKTKLGEIRSLSNKLGKKTWGIFWWQIGTFSAGIFFLILSVIFSVGNKLL